MQVTLEPDQVMTLRDILHSTMKQLQVETRHTDTRAFRETLMDRERIIEAILDKLETGAEKT